MRHSRCLATIVGGFVLLSGAGAEAQLGLGPVFQVNTSTVGYQGGVDVDTTPSGEFLVVWHSESSAGTDSSGFSIQAQRFDADESPSGSEFQVNTITTGDQFAPSLAFDDQGEAIVVWGNAGDIAAQRYDASGDAVGGEFAVSASPFDEFSAMVAVDGAGTAMVVWGSFGSTGTDTDGYSVQARRYDASGSPLGPSFQVNTSTAGNQFPGDVSIGPDGSAVVVWEQSGLNPIRAQRYDPGGDPAGSEFGISSSDGGRGPAVAHASTGSFVVSWIGLRLQRFDASGAEVGSPFEVPDTQYTNYFSIIPTDLAIAPAGDFTVIWGEGNETVVKAQRFSSADAPVGDSFEVAAYGGSNAYLSASIVTDAQGKVVVVWGPHHLSSNEVSGRSIRALTLPALGALGLLALAAISLVAGVRSLQRNS